MRRYPAEQPRKTDLIVKYCPECSRCWERTEYKTHIHGHYVVFYDKGTFPSIGKERKICKTCAEKQNKILNEVDS